MRKTIIGILSLFILSSPAYTQSGKADAWLDKAKNHLEYMDPLYAEFILSIILPEEDPVEQEGHLILSDRKMNIDMDNMVIVSDGKTKWTYMKDFNEVQIDHAADMEFDFGNFDKWITSYEDIDYSYDLTGEENFRGIPVVNIEFKPLNGDSSFSKARIRLAGSDGKPVAFEAFEKNGTRYLLIITDLSTYKGDLGEAFKFNPDEYPDIYVEDLRID